MSWKQEVGGAGCNGCGAGWRGSCWRYWCLPVRAWRRAQVLYGSITGNVTDQSGAALAGAQVTAVEAQTGVTSTQTTDAAGIYRFPALLPGTYKVTISATGFTRQETSGVELRSK